MTKRRRHSWLAHEDSVCLSCDLLMTVREAYRHQDETGHTIRIQRIRMTEVRPP